MEYQKRSVNGDAGEYLVAYTVTRELGWPCRLYGVDLGVDAEMEVIIDGVSDGDIIKVQVKAMERLEGASANVYVDDRHIKYWQRFSAPVIICCVDLASKRVYWKPINATEAYKTGGRSKKVNFDFSSDLLTSNSAAQLRNLVSPPELKEVRKHLDQIKGFLADPVNDGSACGDHEALNELESACQQIQSAISKVEQIGRAFPWRLNDMTREFLSWSRKDVHRIICSCNNQRGSLINGG